MHDPRLFAASVGILSIAVVAATKASASAFDDCTDEYDAPAAYWSFEPSDLVEGAYLDAIAGSAAFVEGSPLAAPGIAGAALRFDGIADHLWIEDNPPRLTTGFTLSIWASLHASPSADVSLIDKWEAPADRSYRLGTSGGGSARMSASVSYDGSEEEKILLEDTVLVTAELEEWVHWAATYDGEELRLYKNGVLIESDGYAAPAGVHQSAVDLWIARAHGSGERLAGDVDELAIWDHALGAEQVWVVFERGLRRKPAFADASCKKPRLALGDTHACALRPDDTLTCWGNDDEGRATPPWGAFRQVDSALASCGVRYDGSIECWGPNGSGQASPPTGTSFSAVATGINFTCGLRKDRTVTCWGSDAVGQSTPPTGVFRQIRAGDYYACGVRFDDTVECWGSNVYGQLDAPGGEFVSVSPGGGHTCALRPDATVECWGFDEHGAEIPPPGYFEEIAAGSMHSCALTIDGEIVCWGLDSGVTPPPAGTFVEIACGGFFNCARGEDGALSCWGTNSYGQLEAPSELLASSSVSEVEVTPSHGVGANGNDAYTIKVTVRDLQGEPVPDVLVGFAAEGAGVFVTDLVQSDGNGIAIGQATATLSGTKQITVRLNPIPSSHATTVATFPLTFELVANGSPPLDLSAGGEHNCAILADGTLRCWGSDAWGQSTPPSGTYSQVGAGSDHTCAIGEGGSISCWGRNNNGQASPPAGQFLYVDGGNSVSCAITSHGTLQCWGSNANGQATPPSGAYVQVSMSVANGTFGCARAWNGSLACWGSNANGQTNAPSGTFQTVSAGSHHACAIREDGELLCWGGNFFGSQPPSGTYLDVAAGNRGMCAIRGDGTIQCWGLSVFTSNIPPGTFTAIRAGMFHVCAVSTDDYVRCWGDNSAGQATAPDGMAVSPNQSAMYPNPASGVLADGEASYRVSVIVRSGSGSGVANQTVTIELPDSSTHSTTPPNTDANGESTVYITSTKPGQKRIVARINAGTPHEVVLNPLHVTFVTEELLYWAFLYEMTPQVLSGAVGVFLAHDVLGTPVQPIDQGDIDAYNARWDEIDPYDLLTAHVQILAEPVVVSAPLVLLDTELDARAGGTLATARHRAWEVELGTYEIPAGATVLAGFAAGTLPAAGGGCHCGTMQGCPTEAELPTGGDICGDPTIQCVGFAELGPQHLVDDDGAQFHQSGPGTSRACADFCPITCMDPPSPERPDFGFEPCDPTERPPRDVRVCQQVQGISECFCRGLQQCTFLGDDIVTPPELGDAQCGIMTCDLVANPGPSCCDTYFEEVDAFIREVAAQTEQDLQNRFLHDLLPEQKYLFCLRRSGGEVCVPFEDCQGPEWLCQAIGPRQYRPKCEGLAPCARCGPHLGFGCLVTGPAPEAGNQDGQGKPPQPNNPQQDPPSSSTKNQNQNKSPEGEQKAADPIALGSGELHFTHSDVRFPSRGIDFDFRRTYRSGGARNGALGPGFFHVYEEYIELVGDRFNRALAPEYCLERLPLIRCLFRTSPGGGRELFVVDPKTGVYSSAEGGFATIRVTRGGFVLREPGGIEYGYNDLGRLESIIDDMGFGVKFTWALRAEEDVWREGVPVTEQGSLFDSALEKFGIAFPGIGRPGQSFSERA